MNRPTTSLRCGVINADEGMHGDPPDEAKAMKSNRYEAVFKSICPRGAFSSKACAYNWIISAQRKSRQSFPKQTLAMQQCTNFAVRLWTRPRAFCYFKRMLWLGQGEGVAFFFCLADLEAEYRYFAGVETPRLSSAIANQQILCFPLSPFPNLANHCSLAAFAE